VLGACALNEHVNVRCQNEACYSRLVSLSKLPTDGVAFVRPCNRAIDGEEAERGLLRVTRHDLLDEWECITYTTCRYVGRGLGGPDDFSIIAHTN